MKRVFERSGAFVALAGLVGAILGAGAGWAYLDSQRTLKRSEVRALAYSHAQRLTQRMQEALGPAYMLAVMGVQVPRSDG